jgi:hypothetical protein
VINFKIQCEITEPIEAKVYNKRKLSKERKENSEQDKQEPGRLCILLGGEDVRLSSRSAQDLSGVLYALSHLEG